MQGNHLSVLLGRVCAHCKRQERLEREERNNRFVRRYADSEGPGSKGRRRRQFASKTDPKHYLPWQRIIHYLQQVSTEPMPSPKRIQEYVGRVNMSLGVDGASGEYALPGYVDLSTYGEEAAFLNRLHEKEGVTKGVEAIWNEYRDSPPVSRGRTMADHFPPEDVSHAEEGPDDHAPDFSWVRLGGVRYDISDKQRQARKAVKALWGTLTGRPLTRGELVDGIYGDDPLPEEIKLSAPFRSIPGLYGHLRKSKGKYRLASHP